MRKEKSCGAVVIKDGKILLEKQTNGFWSFPKGHVEGDETEFETSIRETFEETGIKILLDSSKQFTLHYYIPELDIDKDVILYIGEVLDDSEFQKQASEIVELRWVPIAEVENYFTRQPWLDVWNEILETLH